MSHRSLAVYASYNADGDYKSFEVLSKTIQQEIFRKMSILFILFLFVFFYFYTLHLSRKSDFSNLWKVPLLQINLINYSNQLINYCDCT